jgi:SAM-dependent methyltransferase
VGYDWLVRWRAGQAFVRWIGGPRADDIVARIAPLLPSDGPVLDVGAGACQVAARLVGRGFDVTAVDVRDVSCEPSIEVLVVDGARLPFPDDAFAAAMLITMLHHTRDPELVLREAARVARRVVVMEDVHRGRVQWIATMVMDSIVNLEFFGHPHTNRSDAGWRRTFERLGLDVVASSSKPFWWVFRSATYVLERAGAPSVGEQRAGER